MKKFFALVFLSLFAFKSFSQFDDDNRIQNEFIVLLKPSSSVENILKDFSSLKIKKCLSSSMKIYLLERNTTSSAEDFLSALKKNENVSIAQFNHHVQPRAIVPNDSFFNLQWNFLNTGQSGGIAGDDIQATEAWDINHSNTTVTGDTLVVAIVDGTFDLHHQDINYFVNYNEVDSNGIDDDHNGYIDDRVGWNVFENNENVNGTGDDHATHLAGIAGAVTNNNKGVAGICWGVKILAVDGSSTVESDVVAAYVYVHDMRNLYNNSILHSQGAFIVSCNSSFGVDYGNPADYPLWCAMYDSLGAAGILSAAATANNPVNIDAEHDMPTECPSKWLISVTNTMRNDQLNGGAAYGPINVDLGAPGTAIYSTIPPNTYGYNTGTSMAAPHVAGTVAAMYAAACKGLMDAYHERPDSISLLIKKYLLDGAEFNSSLNTRTVTNGRLNLYRAFLNLKNFNCDSCNYNIGINKIPISCASANDGALAVTVDSGNISAYNIAWSNGNTSRAQQNLSAGFYTVSVTDTSGCTRYASAELHNPDTIIISNVHIIPASNGNAGNITITAHAGNDPLLYSLDGINYQQTAIFSVPTNGNYTVYVKNAEGCVVAQNVLVSGIDELSMSNYQLSIFPNPADDELTVEIFPFQKSDFPLEIFDMEGRKVFSVVPQSSIFHLPSSIFSNGIYFLKVGNATRKFAVIH